MSKRFPSSLVERVAAVETVLDGLMGNGQPGSFQKLADEVEKLSNRIFRLIIVVTLIEVVTHLVTGGGVISLKALFDLLGK